MSGREQPPYCAEPRREPACATAGAVGSAEIRSTGGADTASGSKSGTSCIRNTPPCAPASASHPQCAGGFLRTHTGTSASRFLQRRLVIVGGWGLVDASDMSVKKKGVRFRITKQAG